MITPELRSYVDQELKWGKTPEQLRIILESTGWRQEDIREVLESSYKFQKQTTFSLQPISDHLFRQSNTLFLNTLNEFINHWNIYMAVGVVQLLGIILQAYLTRYLYVVLSSFPLSVVGYLFIEPAFSMIFFYFISVAYTFLIYIVTRGEYKQLKEAVVYAFGNTWKLWVMFFIALCIIFFAPFITLVFLNVLIVGIAEASGANGIIFRMMQIAVQSLYMIAIFITSIWFVFAPFIMIGERKGIRESMMNSKDIVSHHFLLIFLHVCVIGLCLYLVEKISFGFLLTTSIIFPCILVYFYKLYKSFV